MDQPLLAAFVGALFSLIGWGSLLHFSWIVRHWPVTRGRVVGNIGEWRKSGAADASGNRNVWFAEIEYAVGGATHRSKGSVGKSARWDVGTLIELRYNPAKPEQIFDFNTWQRYLFSAAFILFGAAGLAVAAGVIG
ncbi:Protein of unknown function [Parasphingorhabdus marina DSM 22363]|uniref:DUF3592 domain-containing protein n=1 Tax=Parasphingorhabdus marina DSM 22363 TaxID=1123272 RepID=A0A1N6ELS7_9SPHN|nr:DUF3592 domain-containing protein [Parasphingorhabdus marina]SIN83974.1 Protein of unknown function [Parasphingorhabdus marina DSM 22363]